MDKLLILDVDTIICSQLVITEWCVSGSVLRMLFGMFNGFNIQCSSIKFVVDGVCVNNLLLTNDQ